MCPPLQGVIHREEVKTQTIQAMITLRLVDPLIDRFVIFLKQKFTISLLREFSVNALVIFKEQI